MQVYAGFEDLLKTVLIKLQFTEIIFGFSIKAMLLTIFSTSIESTFKWFESNQSLIRRRGAAYFGNQTPVEFKIYYKIEQFRTDSWVGLPKNIWSFFKV